jgi:peptidyl-prolyl cis-trans isomerase D
MAFANKFGFHLSKRLIDAEIAQLPQTKGLNGQFNQLAYQQFLAQQRLTDTQVRQILSGALLQRQLITPIAIDARVPVGVATPYASMLLEFREGQAAVLPIELFRAGLKPSDNDLQRFYAANRARYTVPEQRVLRFATIGPEQAGSVSASEQEIAAYYNANKATYAGKDERTLSQVVVPDQATAAQIAARAKGGATLQAAAAPAGNNAAVSDLGAQTRAAYASAAGEKVAAAVFAAPSGAVVGPVQSDFGWVVVKVQSVRSQPGRTLDQARSEIAAKLTADKRKQSIEDMVDKVQTAIDDGSNFTEVSGASKLPVTTTPLITANGASRVDPSFHLSPDLAAAMKSGFEIAANDPPEIVALPGDKGYVVVSPGQVVAAAPAPLGNIRDQVATDWINQQASQRAKAAAQAMEAKANQGVPLAQALQQVGVPLPAVRPIAARRIQIANAQGEVPAPMRMLFTVGQGKTRMLPDPEGRGYFVVKVDKIVPGNALLQPGLIAQMRKELQQSVSEEIAQQFMAAMRAEVKVKRNESAIQTLKTRLSTGS